MAGNGSMAGGFFSGTPSSQPTPSDKKVFLFLFLFLSNS